MGDVKLNAREEKFCIELMRDNNQTQAAIRAGYSPKTARSQASRLLTKPNVRARVEQLRAAQLQELQDRVGFDAEKTMAELGKLFFVNIIDVVDPKTGILLADARREDLAAVASYKVKTIPTKNGEGIEREVRLHDKTAIAKLAMQHQGMLKDRITLEGADGDALEIKLNIIEDTVTVDDVMQK